MSNNSNPNPYRQQDERRRSPDLDDLASSVVNFGMDIGSTVLSSIADALNAVGDSLNGNAPAADNGFVRYRRRLDSRLSNHYGGWMTMGVLGWICFGCFAVAALVMAILLGVAPGDPALQQGGPVFQVLAPIFSAVTLGFGVMGWQGCHIANYFGRLRRYLRTARDYTVPVRALARDAMIRPERVEKDLRKAVAEGHYPNACLDRAGETLYLDDTLFHPAQEPMPADAPDHAQNAPVSDREAFRREGAAFLDYLRDCRGALGPEADNELAEMDKTCAAVMGFVFNHPEQLPRLRRFREYYLPTTRKLLDTARGLNGPQTGKAGEIRRDITGILHTLNTAYARLYDTLLQDVSMDVSTEIDTLEAMLSQDGLTHNFESDFGSAGQKGSTKR